MGISGDRTQHLLWRVEHGALNGCVPKVVVVLIGTNNRTSDSPVAIAQGIEEVAVAAHHYAPAAKVIVMGVFPVGAEPTNPNRAIVAEINRHVRGRLRNYARFLDIGPQLLAADRHADMSKMAGDALHLQGPGFEVWAEALERAIERLLPK
jgi:lysophospholipase L1-like esterase